MTLTCNQSVVKNWPLRAAVLSIACVTWVVAIEGGSSPVFTVTPQNSVGHSLATPVQFVNPIGKNSADEFSDQIKVLLNNYCQECHWGAEAEAGLDLSRFDSQESAERELETWKSIVEAVEFGVMPPDDAERPNKSEVKALREWFLRTATSGKVQRPQASVRRFNQTEYENTVRDLLRLRNDLFGSPSRMTVTDDYFKPATHRMPGYVLALSYDFYFLRMQNELPGITRLANDPPVAHGFNNDQSTLSSSPLYLESCLSLAHAIVNNVNFPRESLLWDSMFVVDDTFDNQQQVRHALDQLSVFLTRAFRRPVTESELSRYGNLFQQELKSSDFTAAMKSTVAAVLSSPLFLFRTDFADGAGEGQPANPYSMASRLSYFLWGSMPDDLLFQAAAENRLKSDAEILAQVHRMLDDRKIKNLATDFGRQWLKLDKIYSARPAKNLFPAWYRGASSDSPGTSMMIEQMLLFETIMVENRAILEFVDADFAYLNRLLMDWYKLNAKELIGYIPEPNTFEDFFRIQLPNKQRGGVITSGAMLVSTSATTRTSPVYRGAWILDVIFNRPPPPPPPNVPALDGDGQPTTTIVNVRDKLAVHRENKNCAVCHDKLDPIGFALESFDPVGRLRKVYADGSEIDAKGQLSGADFDGAVDFKAVILKQKERFVLGFVEHLTRYAMGRELDATDAPEIMRMADNIIRQEYRFRSVIEQVALAKLFRGAPGAIGVESK